MLIVLSLFVIGTYSVRAVAAQDPMRPPSWMTGSSKTKVRDERLNLQQILISNDRKSAVINNKLVNEGDIIKGAKVKKIDRERVIVMRSGRRQILRLVPTIKEYVNE
jgi:type II secretory pathway component PulC